MADSRRRITLSGFILIVTFFLLLVCVPIFAATESTQGCGIIDQSLLGKDPRVAVPWTATIYYQSASKCGDFRPIGQGVIIGPTTILMNGYFIWASSNPEAPTLQEFKPSNFMVAVGFKSKQPIQTDQFTQFLKVSQIRAHPKSFIKYLDDDFAIIHLKNPIQFSSYVRPLCLDSSPEASLPDVNSTYKLGDLSLSGYRLGKPDIEPFGLLDSSICIKKLETEFQDATQSRDILISGAPCGLTSKSREDVKSWSGYGNGLIQARFLDFTQMARLNQMPVYQNPCFQKGSSIVTFHSGRWHLVGITADSLGHNCKDTAYFISFVTWKNNIDWILKNVWFSTQSFVCNNGQTIELKKVCSNFRDCEDASDEDESYCSAQMCGSFFSTYCSRCEVKDSFHMLTKIYYFSNATSSQEIKCPPLKQPENSLVHCENPTIKSRISCEYGSDPGTKAIFQCKNAKPNEPSSYCVISCKDDGKWTDELKSYNCKSTPTSNNFNGIHNQTKNMNNILFGNRKNATISISSAIQNNSKITTEDASLEEWSPPLLLPSSQIGDKTGHTGPFACSALKIKPGLKIRCRSTTSNELVDCSKPVKPGTKAEFECEHYYRPLFNAASVIKTCQPDGRWTLENRAFECRLDCGIPKQNLIGHVVNGVVTDGSKWPWHGAIFRKPKDGKLIYICGSTLISRRLLITAAHCVTNRAGKVLTPEEFTVVLGATSSILEENYGDPNTQIFQLSNITINPVFNLQSFESDIAIIRLKSPVNISDFVRPSCFPSTYEQHNELLHLSEGSEGHLIGFGYDETGNPSTRMKEAVLPVVSYSECYQILKVQVSSTMFCAGWTNGTAACNGDSGGGIFFEDVSHPRRMFLQGIVSHGNKDESTGLCDHNKYSVFTKVASFKQWIYDVGLELDDEF